MNANEVRAELAMKSIELNQALEAGRPHIEVMEIYRELKRLQFEIVQEKMRSEQTARFEPATNRYVQ